MKERPGSIISDTHKHKCMKEERAGGREKRCKLVLGVKYMVSMVGSSCLQAWHSGGPVQEDCKLQASLGCMASSRP